MAGDGGRQSRSVEEQLFGDASRFSFLQAVRLLEQMSAGGRALPGEGVSPGRELVLFRQAVRLDFPATDVEELAPRPSDDQPYQMTVNVLGLTGAQGPLPHHITEQILERKLSFDRGWRDFLDIFNHRLISLLYRARKKYRPALDARGPDGGRVSTVLFSLLGLGMRGLRQRMGVHDRTLLPYAGFLADQHRCVAGLERVIEHCFGVAAKVSPFQGRWHDLNEDDRTRIGVTGRNQILGRGTVLGRRIWDQAASFEVRLGPMPLKRFRTFLPEGGAAFRSFVALVRFYVREELGFTVRLVLESPGEKNAVPELPLSRNGGFLLGRTAWLRRRPNAALSRNAALALGRTSWLRRAPAADTQVTFVGAR